MSTNESLIDQLIREKRDRPAVNVVGTVKDWYKKNIGADLPLANVGATDFHKSLRLEHSRAFDVGLDPRTREGQRLIGFLDQQGIPYLAFDRAIAGTSTGPHIHIGPPSQRGVSLVDRLVQEKEQFGEAPQQRPLTAADRRGEYGTLAFQATHPERDPVRMQRLNKLAHDINWHFGYSVLMAMPKLPEEKQREIIEKATQFAQEDEEKKKRGTQIVESQLWKYRNQDLVGIREGKEIEVRQPPDVAAEMERQWRAYENPLMHLPNSVNRLVRILVPITNVTPRMAAETLTSAGGGLIEFGAGVGRLAEAAGSPGAKVGREFLEKHGKRARLMAAESQELSERRKGTRIAQGVGSGLIEFAPLVLIPELGLESVMARIGAAALTGGAYTGTQAAGRGESKKGVLKETAVGGATFGLLGVPLPGRTALTRGLSNVVIVGGGTTLINRATGQPWEDAAIHGLVMTLLNSPKLLEKVKVQEADGTERPATKRDIKGLLPAARFEMETNLPIPEAGGRRPYYRSPQGALEAARQQGRRLEIPPGQKELFSFTREGGEAGRTDLPGRAPSMFTLEQYARMKDFSPEDPYIVSRYAEYVENFKKQAQDVQQMSFPLAGEAGERIPTYDTETVRPIDLTEAQLSQQYPGVLRMSEQTARLNLQTLKDLKDSPAWKKLSKTQKEAVNTQIKRYEEQSVGEIPTVEPDKVGDRGRLRYTIREQLDPNKARLMHRERAKYVRTPLPPEFTTGSQWAFRSHPNQIATVIERRPDIVVIEYTGTHKEIDLTTMQRLVEEGKIFSRKSSELLKLEEAIQQWKAQRGTRETSTPESIDQRVERLTQELRTESSKEFLKSEKGSGPDLETLRYMFTGKRRDVKDLGSVERKRNVRPEALRGVDQFVREQRAEQEYADNLSRLREAENRTPSDVIDLTGKSVDVRVAEFLRDETGSLNLDRIRRVYRRLRGKPVNPVPENVATAAKRYIEITDEVLRLNFAISDAQRMGSKVTKAELKALRDRHQELTPRAYKLEESIHNQGYKVNLIGEVVKQNEVFPSVVRDSYSLKEKLKYFLKDEEGSFKPEELKQRIRELLKKNPNLSDVELKALLHRDLPETVYHSGTTPFEKMEVSRTKVGTKGRGLYFAPTPEGTHIYEAAKRGSVNPKNIHSAQLEMQRPLDLRSETEVTKFLGELENLVASPTQLKKAADLSSQWGRATSPAELKTNLQSVLDSSRGAAFSHIKELLGWNPNLTAVAKSLGYDGIRDTTEHVVFDRSQIKTSPKFTEGVEERHSGLPINIFRSRTPPDMPTAPKSLIPEVEARMKAAEGIQTPGVIQKTKEAVQGIYHSFKRTYPELDPNKSDKHAVVNDLFRRHEATPVYSKAVAFNRIAEVTENLGKNRMQAFSRALILPDILKDIQEGRYKDKELPFGYKSEADVRADMAHYDAIAKSEPAVADALQRRQEFVGKLVQELVDAELLSPEVLKDPRYYHRQVMEYMNDPAWIGTGSQDLRMHQKGFQKSRKGGGDFNTRYQEAEFEWVSQAISLLERKKTLEQIKQVADIKPDLEAQAELWNKTNVDKKTWRDFVPADHTVWQPKEGGHFYPTLSMTERTMNKILSGSKTLEKGDLRRVLAMGKRNEQWVVPEEIAKTMDDFRPIRDEGPIERTWTKIQSTWKQAVLLLPTKVLKYNFNNLSGDLDIALAYDPKILRHFKRAAQDVWQHQVKGKASAEVEEAIRMGVVDSGLTLTEVPDINKAGAFRALASTNTAIVRDGINAYWSGVRNFTAWRENILRLSAYRYFKERLAKGDVVYGASNKEQVDAIRASQGNDAAAAKLARELVGDYGAVSTAGRWIRRHLIPFYSWIEINAPRYVRMIKNLPSEGGSPTGAVASKLAAMTGRTLVKGGALAIKAQLLMLAAATWNQTMFPDEEKELRKEGREPHLILGRSEDGSIRTIRLAGALADALDWFNLADYPSDIADLASGKKTPKAMVAEGVEAPPQKVVQSLEPVAKTAFEVATGRTTFPTVFSEGEEFFDFRTRPIRDRGEYIARVVALDELYRRVTHRPSPPTTGGSLFDLILTKRTDPGEAAYWEIRGKAADWSKKQGRTMGGGEPTERSNALYYYRQAIKWRDEGAAKHWLQEYKRLGGTEKGMTQSLRMGHPLGMLKAADDKEFKKTLSPEDAQMLEMAVKWYEGMFGKNLSRKVRHELR